MSDDNVTPIKPGEQKLAPGFLNEIKQRLADNDVKTIAVVAHDASGELQVFSSADHPLHTIGLLAGAIDAWAQSIAQQGEADDPQGEPSA